MGDDDVIHHRLSSLHDALVLCQTSWLRFGFFFVLRLKTRNEQQELLLIIYRGQRSLVFFSGHRQSCGRQQVRRVQGVLRWHACYRCVKKKVILVLTIFILCICFNFDFPFFTSAGFARIFGYPVGIIGNNGVLFSESAKKVTENTEYWNEKQNKIFSILSSKILYINSI